MIMKGMKLQAGVQETYKLRRGLIPMPIYTIYSTHWAWVFIREDAKRPVHN